MKLEVENISFSYRDHDVLQGLSFSADSGDVLAVLGPNGVGKSTLFGCILGMLKVSNGKIEIDGRSIYDLSRIECAEKIAYIPQSASPTYNYTVMDTVLMGTTRSIGLFSHPGPEQKQKAAEALESLGIAHLAGRGCCSISGGERQLALIARALVQNAGIILMDEPTANLDYGNSFLVMEKIETLGKNGYTVIFSSHEPNHAFRYANRVLALKGGRTLACGESEQVLTEENLSKLYGINVAVSSTKIGSQQIKLSVPYREEKFGR